MKKHFLLFTLIAATVSAWGAEYTLKRSLGAVAVQYGWANNTKPEVNPIVLNNALSIQVGKTGYGVVRNTENVNNTLFFYTTNGAITFKGRKGVTIKSIKVTWSVRYDDAFLTRKEGGGKGLLASDAIASGTKITVNANSISFWVGTALANKDNPSLHITDVEIEYSDPTIFLEKFTDYPSGGGSSKIIGDNGIYNWSINAKNRTEATVGNYTGIKLEYGQSIASDGDLEGGIKSVSFDWRTPGKNYPNHFIVKVGSSTDDVSVAMFSNTSLILNYRKDFSIASNTTFSITNPAKESPQQNHLAIGPVHITPYLLFTAPNHAVSVDCSTTQTYDLKQVLINNTDTTPVYTIKSNSCGGYPEIVNGVLDLGSVTKEGAIVVKATWGKVSTTLTVNVTGSVHDITGYHKRILLWPNGTPESNGYTEADEYYQGTGWYKIAVPKLFIYRPTSGTSKGTILVIPGGGYGTVGWSGEGSQVAERLVADGWAAAVLKYRLPNGHDSIPLRDACRAMELLKDSAAQWGLNPDGKFGVAGFSAGGHLASTLVTKFLSEKARPDFGILIYPVITLEAGKTHNGTRTNLLGSSPSAQKVNAWSTHTQVTANTPPCLLALCQDDPTVPTISSVLMYNALCDKHIYAEMVITPTGGHAWGAKGTSLVQRDVVDDAVFKFLNSTVLASSPSRLSPVAYSQSPSRRLTSVSNIDIYEPSTNPKSTILSLLGTDERKDYFVSEGYRVAVVKYRTSASKADSLADVEQAMQAIRQWQTEAGRECAVGCMAKGSNVPFAVSIMAQNANKDIRPDFGILLSPDVSSLDLTKAVTASTSPCIVIADQEDDVDVRNSTQFYMAMTNADRRECELVLTPQTSTIDLAICRFLEDKAYTTATVAKRSIAAMAEQLGWADNAMSGNLTFNNVVSLIYEKPLNQGRYSSGKGGLRCYQQSGYYTIQARQGATIKSIKLTYSAWDSTLKGVVVKDWGTDGYNRPESVKIASGQTYAVNANSIRLWTGSTSNDQGAVCITDFEIVYTDSLSVTEHYTSLATQSSTSDEYFHGDQGLYDWKIKNYQHDYNDEKDFVNGVWGIRLKYNGTTSEGYLAMNGNQEGGVKDISFDYHALNNTMPFHFLIKQGSTTKGEFTHAKTSNANYIYNYTQQLNCSINTAISIVMPKQETPQQAFITMGPVTITPYLLYTKKVVTLKLEEMAGQTYTNTALINNTAGGTITYSIIGTNAANIASIDVATGAVTALGEGQVTVKATWGQVSTTYQLIIKSDGAGSHTATGNVAVLAKQYGWQNGNGSNCYTDFQLDDVISVSSSANNSKYLYNATENCLRFYQATNKGQFTIRAKAGVTIQSIKLDYHLSGGVVTNVWKNSGKSVADANQVKSGVPFNVGANSITLYTGSTGDYTDKQVRIDNFEVIYSVPKQLTLSEEDLNTAKIVEGEYDEIQLIRTLYADRYNTFCVPFAVVKDEMVTYFGEGCKLYALADAVTDAGITINFDESSDGIAAGVPYLMEVQEDVVNPVFVNRTISATTAGNVVSGVVTFQGVYCQTLLHRESTPMEYFLASNNLLYRPVADENMKGLRAYFKVSAPAGTPIRMAVNRPTIPTEVINVNVNENENHKMIINNQLIIMHEGKAYNAQGIRL